MTNNGKKIACVSLASALCLGVGFSAVLGPISASADSIAYDSPQRDSSSPLLLGQFGTITARVYDDMVNGSNIYLSTALPLFREDADSSTDTNYRLDGDVLYPATWTAYESVSSALSLRFLTNSQYTPALVDECSAISFNLRNLVFDFDAFRDICDNTFVYMPIGWNYRAVVNVEYLTADGSYETYTHTLNNIIYALPSSGLNGADIRHSITQLLGLPTGFWTQPLFINTGETMIDRLYVFREFSLDITPIYDNTSVANGTGDCGVFATSNYSWLDYLDYEDTLERYYISQQGDTIVPPPADILFSPVEAFFATELFDGFTLGNLLGIALGCLLFGLFLKIFAGG